MNYRISHPTKIIKGEINLPASKSISNRLLIINELSSLKFKINNLSDSTDTITMQKMLYDKNSTKIFDVNNAGTVMRFLTAYFATQQGERVLTGSDRMKERPIGILVDILKNIGADISYMEKEGFPPIKINGKKLNGGLVHVNSSVSSQFISALLLITPQLNNDLTIIFENKPVSLPYIQMTMNLMKQFNVCSSIKGNQIHISKQKYLAEENILVESDWSAASYWYAIAAIAEKAEIKLNGLQKNSIQGDKIVAELFEKLGVNTVYKEDGVFISKNNQITNFFEFDFTNYPDIAQTIAVVIVAKGIRGKLTGLSSLKIKETNRLFALKTELEKLGAIVSIINDSLEIEPGNLNLDSVPCIITYSDHRMAMAFAPLAIINCIEIENPMVTQKSYPNFWKDLKKANFNF